MNPSKSRNSHNTQSKCQINDQMYYALVLPFSMNEANNSTSPEDDPLGERRRSWEFQESQQKQSHHSFLPIPNHAALPIRIPSDGYYDTDGSDGLRAFPLKLHACLDDAEAKGFNHIISWQDHSFFKIKDTDAFEKHIMPEYFKSQSKYKSFQRQLNLYEFGRIPKGPFKGSYTHQFFKRGQPELSNRMRLRKIKGRNSGASSPSKTRKQDKAATIPSQPSVHPESSKSSSRQSSSSASSVPRRPKNRSTSHCTFEGRKFFPI